MKYLEQTFQKLINTKELNIFSSQDIKQIVIESSKGILFGIKDNIDVAQSKTTGGCKAFDNHFSQFDCSLWSKLKLNGALNGGRTIMHELAYGTTTMNEHYGYVRNPYDTSRTAGGSSGGSGALVGAGIFQAALGTDTGGSIRIPAAYCGAVAGCMDDIAYLDEIVSGQTHIQNVDNPKIVRLGVPSKHYFDNLDTSVSIQIKSAIDNLRSKGMQIIESDSIDYEFENILKAVGIVLEHEFPQCLDQYLKMHRLNLTMDDIHKQISSPDLLEDFAQCILNPQHDKTRLDYEIAVFKTRQELINATSAYFERNKLDAMIYPTSKIMPFKFEDYDKTDMTIPHNGQRVKQIGISIENTVPASFTNSPCISLPISFNDTDFPIGLENQCQNGEDQKLIAISKMIEQILRN
ncbi:UNKNOWN [Stylonychia lemnae]|uniref:Amidase domain-containing protein n=1 Tax=Stylonychia lemnae TaxID=5949 RepID=A0A078AP95_STYLE|nr:UNKNOWN [Stylonychia lemnae]|eukprot:CDW83142.1 UNKNOWN [Stylonychia lemnae]